jgi:hypothetical protein
MSKLNPILHVLLDDERYDRLKREAARRGASVYSRLS